MLGDPVALGEPALDLCDRAVAERRVVVAPIDDGHARRQVTEQILRKQRDALLGEGRGRSLTFASGNVHESPKKVAVNDMRIEERP